MRLGRRRAALGTETISDPLKRRRSLVAQSVYERGEAYDTDARLYHRLVNCPTRDAALGFS
jgi:hypothetical protein